MARTRNGHPKLDRGWTIVFDRQLLADTKRAARLLFDRRGERVSMAELVRRSLRKEVASILDEEETATVSRAA